MESAWQLADDGTFVMLQEASRGAWIPCADALDVEFIGPAINVTELG